MRESKIEQPFGVLPTPSYCVGRVYSFVKGALRPALRHFIIKALGPFASSRMCCKSFTARTMQCR